MASFCRFGAPGGWAAALAGLLVFATTAIGATAEWRQAAERAYTAASGRMAAKTNQIVADWEFARACFDLAEYATNSSERAALAKAGIEAARGVIARAPTNAAAHYYLGMNLGQLARTRFLSALKMVDEMEREFLRTRQLEPGFDYAGPDRNLGLLYRDAPSFGSVGNRRKAQQHMEGAVRSAPGYPENRLNLVESYLQWGDHTQASRELKVLNENWAEARKKFTGPEWRPAWADWEARRARATERIRQGLPGIKSPRDK